MLHKTTIITTSTRRMTIFEFNQYLRKHYPMRTRRLRSDWRWYKRMSRAKTQHRLQYYPFRTARLSRDAAWYMAEAREHGISGTKAIEFL